MRTQHRLLMTAAAGAAAMLVAALTIVVGQSASAATLFSDNFEDGNNSGWSSSGGSWSVVSDGSFVDRQSNATSERGPPLRRLDELGQLRGAGQGQAVVLQRFQPGGGPRVAGRQLHQDVPAGPDQREPRRVAGHERQFGHHARVGHHDRLDRHLLHVAPDDTAAPFPARSTAPASARPPTRSDASGRVGFYTEFATASFDDITVDTVGSSHRRTRREPPPPAARAAPPASHRCRRGDLVGWATQGGGTTGGAGGPTVTVTSLAALTSGRVVDDRADDPGQRQLHLLRPTSGDVEQDRSSASAPAPASPAAG